uniref:Major facilitator superfamily (MFS) profile domain-containing protein n=1 Tax=Graphocephala atropunctata TaxID=36148 RepID=A0A1B6LZB8_9HEMI
MKPEMESSTDSYARKSVIIQIAVTVLANTGMFLSGMVLGFPSAILGPLVESDTPGYHASVEEGSWISSVAAIASPVGCLLGGPLVDKLGRRRGLQVLNLPNIAGWLLLSLVPFPFQSIYPLIAGRILTGFAAGLATAAAATYTAEVVTPQLRTLLVTMSPGMMGFGIFTVYLLADLFQDQWTIAAGVGIVVSIVSILFTPFLPESPMWLLARNAPERAKQSLLVLRGTISPNIVEAEFKKMMDHLSTKNNKTTWANTFQDICKPEAYKPLIIMNMFFLFQQLSGVTVVIVYGVKFAKDAELSEDAYTVALFIGIVRVISTFITTWLCNRWGRRKPAVAMGVGVTLSLLVLSGYLALRHSYPQAIPSTPWVSIICILVNILTSSIVFSTMLWSMLGEVFPTNVRGVCSGLTSCIGYIISFMTIKFYPIVEPMVGNIAAFVFFGISALVGTIFLAIYLPETYGKTLSEIEEYFRGSKKTKTSSIQELHHNS